ncbi:MAG: alpha/beta hydrolase fold domain-containing protein, partial [Eubacteriales bacterium]|nr:alpha/beta hydrolase fold domain-containing protein [Eubacteriales bacterium]
MQKPSPRERILTLAILLPLYLPFFLGLSVLRAHWFGWVAAGLALVFLFWLGGRPLRRGIRLSLSVSGAMLFTFLGLFFAAPQPGTPLLSQLENGLARAFPGPPIVQTTTNDTGWTPPDGYTLQIIQLPDYRLEWLAKASGNSSRVVLQLHGGAFAVGMHNMYREFAVRYSKLFGNCAVATPDYRLAPDYPYPCQQEDTMNAWRYLTDALGYAPENILVAGDSAGGNLALSLGLRLRDAGEAMPAGFVCMSPWADLSNSGPSHVYNAVKDPSFGIAQSD